MKSVKILMAAAVALLFASACDRKVDFPHETFATFNTTKYVVDETVGELKVPVSLYNPTGGELQVAVKAISASAEENVDFEIVSPSSGLLTFSGDVDTLDVVVKISDQFVGEFTGPKSFGLEISSATEGLAIGNFNTVNVSINDLDHPLSALFGDWSATTFEEAYLGTDVTLTFNIAADPNDIAKVIVSIVDPMMSSVVGYTTPVVLAGEAKLNDDGTGTIVIANGQYTGFTYSYGAWVYLGFDAPSFVDASDYTNIVMNYGPDGITVPNGFGIFDDKYIWASYVGGYTLTK